ncbi:transcriptional elongation regulator elc1 elongin c [Malassezia pachydermatis]|uniref:Elongin-C n=1 Tax=Malassezia pachydermatis TaxID=77020 RepID=A0A0M8MQ07_9BASI|nr:transcriptional elongation regulator elc1 elongin c [Malassezia pachydermatis]KOS14507.1 transcriptional elongation regulator elc1 elongin c [Malassezia pachydermatis]
MPTQWVTLLSDDGYRFIVDMEWAMLSGTIKSMLSMEEGSFSEAESGVCKLQIRSGQVLEKVVEYLQWHARNKNRTEFNIKEFERKIPPELALELYVDAMTLTAGLWRPTFWKV